MAYPLTYTPEPKKPSGGPRPGTKRLYAFCIDTFDVAVHPPDDIKGLGIYNPRDVRGNPWPNWTTTGSQHARGAAGDCGVPVVRPEGHTEGHRLSKWLVANHAALGVQEVIWAGRRWHNGLGVIDHADWPKYGGKSDHFDHVHWAQNDAAADGLTDAEIRAVWSEEDDMSAEAEAAIARMDHVVGKMAIDVQSIRAETDKFWSGETITAIAQAVKSLLPPEHGGDGLTYDEAVAAAKQALREGSGG